MLGLSLRGIPISEIVAHEADDPNAVVDLLDAKRVEVGPLRGAGEYLLETTSLMLSLSFLLCHPNTEAT
jgi:hypothetical protein